MSTLSPVRVCVYGCADQVADRRRLGERPHAHWCRVGKETKSLQNQQSPAHTAFPRPPALTSRKLLHEVSISDAVEQLSPVRLGQLPVLALPAGRGRSRELGIHVAGTTLALEGFIWPSLLLRILPWLAAISPPLKINKNFADIHSHVTLNTKWRRKQIGAPGGEGEENALSKAPSKSG